MAPIKVMPVFGRLRLCRRPRRWGLSQPAKGRLSSRDAPCMALLDVLQLVGPQRYRSSTSTFNQPLSPQNENVAIASGRYDQLGCLSLPNLSSIVPSRSVSDQLDGNDLLSTLVLVRSGQSRTRLRAQDASPRARTVAPCRLLSVRVSYGSLEADILLHREEDILACRRLNRVHLRTTDSLEIPPPSFAGALRC